MFDIFLINQNGGCTKHFSLTSDSGFCRGNGNKENPPSEVKEKCFMHPPF
jgi:hypothetical protein